MSKRVIPIIIIVTMACFSAFDMATAQESQVIHFQGLLTGPDGGPLTTDIYNVNFSIWDHATNGFEPLWSEIQVIEVTDGLFDVFLGSQIPLSADVFTHAEEESDLRYLQIQVEGDDPMTPRIQIAKTPNSFVSSRMLGDIQTGPGSLKMMDPVDDKVGFDVFTGGEGNSIKLMDPSDDEVPVTEISCDGFSTSMKLIDPGDDEIGFDVFIGGEGNSIKMMDPGDDGMPAFDFSADGISNIHSFKLMDPGDDGLAIPSIEITADAGAASFKMMDPGDDGIGFDVFIGGEGNSIKMMDPSDDENSLIEMNGGISGDASIKMFNPQPEPPAVLMEMSSAPSSGASIVMFNPQPEPPEPLLEMNSTQYGASLAMAAPGAGGLRSQIDNPVLEISTGLNNLASIYMFNPQPEPPAVVTSMVSSTEGASFTMYAPLFDGQGDVMFDVFIDAQGANLSLSDEIGKYMGFEPSPFVPGGRFRMYDPITDAVKFEVETTENGAGLNMNDEIGKYMGLDPSPFNVGGFLHMYDPSTDNTMVSLGSDGHITAHNGTFGLNTNTGTYSLAVGDENIVSGDNSFAGGRVAEANHDNCFVWSDYPVGPSVLPTQTSADNQFLVRATVGTGFYSNADFTSGVFLGAGASSWWSIIPGGPELNTRPVDGEEILTKIERLPLKYYSHKDQDDGIEHIGPLPEDFNELFGFGMDDTHISMQDESGVALAGVKELIQENRELRNLIMQMERRISEMEERIR